MKTVGINSLSKSQVSRMAGTSTSTSSPSAIAPGRGRPLHLHGRRRAALKVRFIHDLTAARAHCLGALYAVAAVGIPTLVDKCYQGAGTGMDTPGMGNYLEADNRAYNALLAGTRSIGERPNALLEERWKALRHVTLSPSRIGPLSPPRCCSPPTSVTPDEKISVLPWHGLAARHIPHEVKLISLMY